MIASVNRIFQLVAKEVNADVNRIAITSHLSHDLGYDSLDVVELVFALEKEYDIVITDDEAEELITVNDVVLMVEKYLKRKIA